MEDSALQETSLKYSYLSLNLGNKIKGLDSIHLYIIYRQTLRVIRYFT
jgi:hypothetical protein